MAEMYSMEGMLDMYLFENRQLLERLQEMVLGKKEEEGFDENSINEIFRIMHTIKSSSTVMMFDEIKTISHKLEDVFFYLRESKPTEVSYSELTAHILEVQDFIIGEMEKLESGGTADGNATEICSKLELFLEQTKKNNGNNDAQDKVQINQDDEPKQFYIAPKAAKKDKTDFDVGLIIDLDSSVEEIEERMQHRKEKEEDRGGMIPGDFVIQPRTSGRFKHRMKGQESSSSKPSFISVDTSKMEQLEVLVGKLLSTETEVFQNETVSIPESIQEYFQQAGAALSQISGELQAVVRSMHMVPLTNTFQKMHRVVFDVSKKLGKDISFEMVGDQTEVDKNVISHISAPLMHLVRNAADHGIETNADRKAAGKTEKGKITLSATTDFDQLSICVADNGAGLNREKILQTAKSKGLLDTSIPDSSYTDAEVYQFITIPGFSTKKNVTEFSGRGVGMDVVVQELVPIGGTLAISSTYGKGSEMTIQIPLKLS